MFRPLVIMLALLVAIALGGEAKQMWGPLAGIVTGFIAFVAPVATFFFVWGTSTKR